MKKIAFLAMIALGFCSALIAADDTKLLRMPDINRDLIVFVYAGDIWSVPAAGGEAKRLTSHLGLEIFPKISPDAAGSPSRGSIREAGRSSSSPRRAERRGS